MAEALAKERFGHSVYAILAGIQPQNVDDAQNAVNALKVHFNIDASGHKPRDVRTLDLTKFDQIIAMDKHVATVLRTITERDILVWKIEDPWGSDEYAKCALKILVQLNRLEVK